jgi:hypothetical protein
MRNADQGRMRVCYEMQPSNTKHLGTCWNASPDARDRRCRRHPLHDKGFPCSTRRQLEPTAAPPPNTTGQKAWEQTDPALRPYQWDALTYTDASRRRRVKLPADGRSSD